MLEWHQNEQDGKDVLYKEESFKIIGRCMEVHRELGKGHDEIIYKDALEFEFGQTAITFAREKEYAIRYKTIILRHKYFADLVVFDKILLEAKAVERLDSSHVKQVLNTWQPQSSSLACLLTSAKTLWFTKESSFSFS